PQVVYDCGQHALALAWYGHRQLERPQPSPGYGRAWSSICLNDFAGCCAHAVFPASTVMTVPVMFLAPSLRRYLTAAATSSTSTSRRNALRPAICSRCSSVSPLVISVSTKPGATAFTVTPVRPTSRASDRVKPIIDALVAP